MALGLRGEGVSAWIGVMHWLCWFQFLMACLFAVAIAVDKDFHGASGSGTWYYVISMVDAQVFRQFIAGASVFGGLWSFKAAR